MSVLVTLLLVTACKRSAEPTPGPTAAPPTADSPTRNVVDAAPARGAGPTWYRASVHAPDGVETPFLLGVPAPNTGGDAVLKVGAHEVRVPATFDGSTLSVPLRVHLTAVDATVGADHTLTGTFSTTWRAWGASSLPLTATPIASPELSALALVPAGKALDLGDAHSVWKVQMKDSGTAKLVIEQRAPGALEAMLFLDTGNIVYLAGNAAGDQVVLAGFDGTAGYRLELTLAKDHARGTGRFIGGHKLDWRETLTATRVPDFALRVTPRGTKPGVTITLPKLPALANLPAGPLVIEIGGSWCSTCRNAAPLFVDLYKAYAPRGLHMLTLLYEFDDERAIDEHQAEEFTKTYGVTWPVVSVPGAIEDFADIMPGGLTGVNPAGFPITLFLAADRSLVAIHAGFPAKDAPAEFARAEAELRANIEKLLAPTAAPR